MIAQLAILVIGTTCVALSSFNFPPRVRRWYPVLGLCGEPFWYYETYTAQQWGMFAWTLLTTAIFLWGIRDWARNEPRR